MYICSKALLSCVFAVLIVSSSPVGADPSPEISWAMNDPITLFDFGIQRLDDSTGDLVKEDNTIGESEYTIASGFAFYEYSENKLVIGYFIDSRSNPEFDKAKCEAIWPQAREKLFLSEGILSVFSDPSKATMTLIDRYFTHAGFKRKDEPQNLKEKIAEVTYLSLMHGDYERQTNCESLLSEGRIIFSQQNTN